MMKLTEVASGARVGALGLAAMICTAGCQPAVSSSRPGPTNTGVPAGTVLTDYTGPCTITTPNTVIDSKTVNCELRLLTANVVIRKSKINGGISNDENLAYSFTLEDSEVNAGQITQPAVWHTNMTIRRSNIHGGQTSVSCWHNCTVEDSWLHGQEITPGISQHLGGFLSNGGTGVVLRHNTIVCDSPGDGQDGGCSGDVNLFGDFEPVTDVLVEDNFLGANLEISFCIYGGDGGGKPFPNTERVVFKNNVVERGANSKCGFWGPVTGFNPDRPGNQWVNNTWDDGTLLESAN